MALDLMRMFVVDLCEMILNFEIVMREVHLVEAVVVVVVDWRMLKDNSLDEIMVVETLMDDHHDQWNHHERTFEDEDEAVVDESLHFDRITKKKNFEIIVSFHRNDLHYVEMDDPLVEHWN